MSSKEKGSPNGYLDAELDIEASIDYCYELNSKKPITLFGSSYSASLALLISTETSKIKAIIAFSPGEYLKGIKLAEKLKNIDKPTFVTSPKPEIAKVRDLVKNAHKKLIDHFVSTVDCFHGSKTLWESVSGYEQYWAALEGFLKNLSKPIEG